MISRILGHVIQPLCDQRQRFEYKESPVLKQFAPVSRFPPAILAQTAFLSIFTRAASRNGLRINPVICGTLVAPEKICWP